MTSECDARKQTTCKVCTRWSCVEYGDYCVMHLERDPALPRTDAYIRDRARVGQFGVRELDGVPFLVAFHTGVYATDGPQLLGSGAVQFQRAKAIELGRQKTYLFVVMNHGKGKRLGAFYDIHENIQHSFRHIPEWPGDMDIYVVDVYDKQEMEFLVSIMAEQPSIDDLRCLQNQWWVTRFVGAVVRNELKPLMSEDDNSDSLSDSHQSVHCKQ